MIKEVTVEQLTKMRLKGRPELCNDIVLAQKLCTEVSEFYPAEVFISLKEEDDEWYYDYAQVKLQHPSLYITVCYRKDKYEVYCEDVRRMPYTDYHDVRAASNEVARPNSIGKLSSRKIAEWIKYYEEVFTIVKAVSDSRKLKEKMFLESLEGLDVSWGKDGINGSIVKNGIEFSFTLGKTYISRKLEIHYKVDNDVASFIKLSDNKY